MRPRAVRTREELAAAIARRSPRLLIRGPLAGQIRVALRVRAASRLTIVAVAAALATIPITGGLSLPAAALVASLTGLDAALIMAASALGAALILSICRDYTAVGFTPRGEGGEPALELVRIGAVRNTTAPGRRPRAGGRRSRAGRRAAG